MKSEIYIDTDSCYSDTYYKGHVELYTSSCPFWLIHTEGRLIEDEDEHFRIQWWLKSVPREVRDMESDIIEQFKQSLNQ